MPHQLQYNQKIPITTLLVKITKTKTIASKPLIHNSLTPLLIRPKNTFDTFRIPIVTLLTVDKPLAIIRKPHGITIFIHKTKDTKIATIAEHDH